VGTIYWSIVMYINGRQMCALTFAGQRKCGVLGTVACTKCRVVRLVLLYQAPCCALLL
jgi:hypothetical protein